MKPLTTPSRKSRASASDSVTARGVEGVAVAAGGAVRACGS